VPNQAQTQSPAAPKEEIPEDLLSRRATKTFQVVVPADFSADQVPTNEISEFLVPGHTGAFLRVEVKVGEGQGGEPQPLLAARMAGESVAVEASTPDYCTDEKLYPLSQDRTIHVVYDPRGRKFPLRFTLLKKDDPMLNVELTAEQVSINYGNLGIRREATVEPYLHSCEVGSSWPAHVFVLSGAGVLYVAQVQGYKNLFPADPFMQNLISSIQQRKPPTSANQLPFAYDDAALVLTSRMELIEGQGWKGWRWIEGASQDGDYPGGLDYALEAITNDGRFFLRMTGQISHPELERLNTENISDEAARDKADKENNQLLKKNLERADPASFTPNLNDIDAMIRSIRVQQ
jgi:hypothetical protein